MDNKNRLEFSRHLFASNTWLKAVPKLSLLPTYDFNTTKVRTSALDSPTSTPATPPSTPEEPERMPHWDIVLKRDFSLIEVPKHATSNQNMAMEMLSSTAAPDKSSYQDALRSAQQVTVRVNQRLQAVEAIMTSVVGYFKEPTISLASFIQEIEENWRRYNEGTQLIPSPCDCLSGGAREARHEAHISQIRAHVQAFVFESPLDLGENNINTEAWGKHMKDIYERDLIRLHFNHTSLASAENRFQTGLVKEPEFGERKARLLRERHKLELSLERLKEMSVKNRQLKDAHNGGRDVQELYAPFYS